jgi:hypothetical protein
MKRPLEFAMLFCSLIVVSVGCQDSATGPQSDDAKKRAVVEGKSAAEAAQYFTYRVYEKEGKKTYQVADYFAGMDSVSSPKDPNVVFHDALLGKENVSGGYAKPENVSAQVASVARPKVEVKPPEFCPQDRIGRNTWMVWCAGNEGFWDWLATDSLGFIDLLKLIDSRKRSQRFADAGMINEPGMQQANTANSAEFGLWLDIPRNEIVANWRLEFVNQTFPQIAQGLHKSQVGLRKKSPNGEFDGANIYQGQPDAFKGEGYRYPSEYLIGAKPYQPDYATQASEAKQASSPAAYEGTRSSYDMAKYAPGQDGYYEQLNDMVPPPDLYGLSSGVVGLRLFPNPNFDAQAQARWNAERYYNDKSYYTDPNLVKPYRVGMSCAFCHASFHPLKPPNDLINPLWENISGNIGAQYLSMRATVGGQLTPDQFVYHLLDSQPRGTIDTSLIASDNINNPNTMNAVFGLRQRAYLSLFNPREKLTSASARLPSLWKDPKAALAADQCGVEDAVLTQLKEDASAADIVDQVVGSNDNPRYVPRILVDGSDSIGTWGALARVYLNIGSYWEQWNELHQVVLGFTPQRPFRLADCEENSVYWNATEQRVPGLRDYFLKITPTMPLLSTPGGLKRITPIDETALLKKSTNEQSFADLMAKERALHVDISQLERGRMVYAKNCIVCHSSIQPESMKLIEHRLGENSQMKGYLAGESFQQLVERRKQVRFQAEEDGEFWEHDPAQWLENPIYQEWARFAVEEIPFWTENFLSTDYRIPVNLVNTNSARAMGTNAMAGHMWEDFASASYRQLPSVGAIEYFNPYKGSEGSMDLFTPRHINSSTGKKDGGGGPGFYRVPTLMSIWATAPLLHNNSLGLYNNDPSVEGRLLAFDDAIRKLLWPERRLEHSSYNGANPERLQQDHGLIWRTPQETYLTIESKRLPSFAHRAPIIAKLHEHRGFRWLHYVQPLWLATVILFAGAVATLLLSNSDYRRRIAYVLLVTAVLVGLLLWLANRYPNWTWLSVLRAIQPWPFPVIILALVAVALWLPLTRRIRRWLGYGLVVVGLFVGAVVYFNAGKLGDLRLGPIPAGTPVNLLANFNSEADRKNQITAIKAVIDGTTEIRSQNLSDPKDVAKVLQEKIAPALMEVNKCPDFVMDKGHYFPWFNSMSDDDKNALIELLKTL